MRPDDHIILIKISFCSPILIKIIKELQKLERIIVNEKINTPPIKHDHKWLKEES